MTAPHSLLDRAVLIAPWISLALIVGLAVALPNRVAFDDAAAARKVEIAAALESVPYFVGDWISEAVEVPPEAQKLLRPNAILSRQFHRPGDIRVHLLVVHCSDSRDMIGHYPPVCYPSSGWVAVPDRQLDGDLIVQGVALPMRTYRFRRAGEHGAEESIRIFSAFVLPDGTVTPEIGDIHRRSARLALAVEGVAQVQIITSAQTERREAEAAAIELLGHLDGLRRALRIGQAIAQGVGRES